MKVLCPNCYTEAESGVPCEPMFELQAAAMFLGMRVGHLRQWLSEHQEVPKLYRKDPTRRLHRMLPGSWIRYIQGQRTYLRPAKGEKLQKLGNCTDPYRPSKSARGDSSEPVVGASG